MKQLKKIYAKFNGDFLKILIFSIVSLLFIGAFATSSDFFTAPYRNAKDVLILFLQWLAIMIVNLPFFYLLSLNKYIYAILYPIISVISCCLAYFRYTTGAIFTTVIFDVTLDSNQEDIQYLISTSLILSLLISLISAFIFVYYRFKKISNLKPSISIKTGLLALIMGIGLLSIYSLRRPSLERIPLNIVAVPYQYFIEYQEIKLERQPLEGELSIQGERPLVVLIIGETLRADHLGLNGYSRNTTPYLSKEQVISYPNIYSEATYTNESLPHILTRADSLDKGRANIEPSFIHLFNRLDYQTIWLANQSPNNSYVYFMNECQKLVYANAGKTVYGFNKWLDPDLLPLLDNALEEHKALGQLIILHTIGSHWYYNTHCSDQRSLFKPITKSRVVSSNTKEEMVNSYDNTILETDYFIKEVIQRLKDKNAMLIYLSDHGEALGEDGRWLHANDVEAAHHPACLLWFSDEYRALHPIRVAQAEANRNKTYRTDFLFHTILEGANIEWSLRDNSLSLFH